MNLSRSTISFISLTIIITILSSCSTRPSFVLKEKKMVAIFEDLILADAIIKTQREDYKLDANREALIDGVLVKHDITQAQLDSSLVWYADNIDLYTQIQDTVNVRLEKRRDDVAVKLKNLKSTYKLMKFDVKLPEYFTLDVDNPTFRFRVDSNKIKSLDKDRFELSFDTQGVDTTLHRIEATLYYQYKDSMVVDKKKILGNEHYVFKKPELNDSLLYEISGYVHLAMATNSMPKVLLNNIENQTVKVVEEADSTQVLSKNKIEELSLEPKFID